MRERVSERERERERGGETVFIARARGRRPGANSIACRSACIQKSWHGLNCFHCSKSRFSL